MGVFAGANNGFFKPRKIVLGLYQVGLPCKKRTSKTTKNVWRQQIIWLDLDPDLYCLGPDPDPELTVINTGSGSVSNDSDPHHWS